MGPRRAAVARLAPTAAAGRCHQPWCSSHHQERLDSIQRAGEKDAEAGHGVGLFIPATAAGKAAPATAQPTTMGGQPPDISKTPGPVTEAGEAAAALPKHCCQASTGLSGRLASQKGSRGEGGGASSAKNNSVLPRPPATFCCLVSS